MNDRTSAARTRTERRDTVELPLQLREAAVEPKSIDAEARTAELVWSTGARVKRFGFFEDDYYEELSLDPKHVRLARLNNGAPVLNAHQRFDVKGVIGVVERAWLKDNEARAKVRFSERTEVDPVWQDVQNGILRNVSVGYAVHRFEDVTKENSKDNLKVMRAVDWEPMEISIVPVGADGLAGMRSQDDKQTNRCLIITRNEDESMEQATETTEERSRADDKRDREIRTLCQRFHLEGLAQDWINRDLPIESVRAAIIDELAKREPPATRGINLSASSGGDSSYDNPEFLRTSISEALACRHTSLKPSDAARPYLHKRLPDIAREILERNGQRTTMLSTNTIIERAMHTTGDFPALLTETGQRVLRAAYDAAPAGVRVIARKNTARDFRALTSVQLGEAPNLERVNEHGEFKYGGMAESKETYKLESYGKIFALSRQSMVNDDLGAFTTMSERLGRAAAEFIAQNLVDLLTQSNGAGPTMSDNVALFHATHANLGTAAAITVASLGTARQSMRLQKGLDKKTPVNVTPLFLLVPAAKETEGEQILHALSADTVQNVNPFVGRLTLVIDPRLDTKSATAWYVFADPNAITTLEYAFLEDDEGPVISTREGFNVDGIEFKVRLDLGAGVLDWRGGFRNPGA